MAEPCTSKPSKNTVVIKIRRPKDGFKANAMIRLRDDLGRGNRALSPGPRASVQKIFGQLVKDMPSALRELL